MSVTSDPSTPLRAGLATRRCVPCDSNTPPLALDDAQGRMVLLPGWRLIEGEELKIARAMRFKDFSQAMAFVNRVADVAEEEGHHPDFSVSWNRVKFELLTHAIGGLSENDFIMAAKINELARKTERA